MKTYNTQEIWRNAHLHDNKEWVSVKSMIKILNTGKSFNEIITMLKDGDVVQDE